MRFHKMLLSAAATAALLVATVALPAAAASTTTVGALHGIKGLHLPGAAAQRVSLSSTGFEAASLTSGDAGFCAVLRSAKVACWGNDSDDWAGIPAASDAPNQPVPHLVPGVAGAVSLASDNSGYCAVLNTGGVECWGGNAKGSLGDGSSAAYQLPHRVSGLAGVKSVVGQSNGVYCAVLLVGAVQCWGSNEVGLLGAGSKAPSSDVPLTVKGLSGVKAIAGVNGVAAGSASFCALLRTGGAECWGLQDNGTLGNSSVLSGDGATSPVPVSGLTGAASLVGSSLGYCAILDDRTVECWGTNQYGSLGNGGTSPSAAPVKVSGLGGVVDVSANLGGYCAALAGGAVKCWGSNVDAGLGSGRATPLSSSVPVPAAGLSNVASLYGGGFENCAVLHSTAVKCWGDNNFGGVGVGSKALQIDVPTTVTGLTGAVSLATLVVGASWCSVLGNGGVKCWGSNVGDDLGQPATIFDSDVPLLVTGFA